MASELVERIRSRCYWQAVIRPEQFEKTRIKDYSRLLPLVEDSTVSLRHWQFPLVDGRPEVRTAGDDWVGEELDWQYGLELWRLYQSGQFVSVRGMWRDWLDRSPQNPAGAGPQNYLPLWDTIQRFTEIYEFAARLSLTEAGDTPMRVDVKIGNLQGRILAQDDHRKTPLYHHIFAAQDFTYPLSGAEPIPRETLVSASRELAAEALVELFRRFGFIVGAAAVRSWQDELDTS